MKTFFVVCLGVSLVGVVDKPDPKKKKEEPAPQVKKAAPNLGPMLPNMPVRLQLPNLAPQGPAGGFVPPMMPNLPAMRPLQMPPMANPFAPRKVELPKELIPALLDALEDQDKDVRQYAAAGLARVGKDAVAPLIDWLRGKDKSRRANAAYVLGHIGSPAVEDALPLLIKALKDDAREVRIRAGFAVQRLVARAQADAANSSMGGMPMPPLMLQGSGYEKKKSGGPPLPPDPGTVAPSAERAKPRKDAEKKEKKDTDKKGEEDTSKKTKKKAEK
jgi:hypothetical protein